MIETLFTWVAVAVILAFKLGVPFLAVLGAFQIVNGLFTPNQKK